MNWVTGLFEKPGRKILYTNRASEYGKSSNSYYSGNLHNSFDVSIPGEETTVTVTVLRATTAPWYVTDDAEASKATWYEMSYEGEICYWYNCFDEDLFNE